VFSKYYKYWAMAKKIASDSEYVHHLMDAIQHSGRDKRYYQRFNVENGVGEIKLGEWKRTNKIPHTTQDQIEHFTEEYVRQVEVQQELQKLARMLVETRIQRSKTSQWESFYA
jgi:hypothetical protein